MRVKTKVNVRIYDDTNERDCLFGPDDTRSEVTNDHYTEMQGGQFSIAASGTLTLSLGTVNAVNGIYIRALGDFDLVLNSGADTLALRRATNTSATTPVKFYMDGTVTAAEITNTSSTSVLVGHYTLWGDEV